MKCSITTSDLLGALKALKPLCTGNGLPVLGCVMIEAKETSVSLFATNLDQSLTITVGATVEKAGKVCVSCGRLAAAIAKIDGQLVAMSSKKFDLDCKGANMELRLFGFDPAEMPGPLKVPDESEIELDPCVLGYSLAKALPFVSDDESRYVLNGINFSSVKGNLRLVSTDGRRLAVIDPEDVDFDSAGANAIVPAEACKRLISLDVGEDRVRVVIAENSIHATSGNWDFAAKLIEGNYPNYQQVIPKLEGRWFEVKREELRAILPFVGVVVAKGTPTVKISADKDGMVNFETNQPEVGSARVQVEGRLNGMPLTSAFNALFLMDAVSVIEGENVRVEMNDGASPAVIREKGALMVVMPMRIDGPAAADDGEGK